MKQDYFEVKPLHVMFPVSVTRKPAQGSTLWSKNTFLHKRHATFPCSSSMPHDPHIFWTGGNVVCTCLCLLKPDKTQSPTITTVMKPLFILIIQKKKEENLHRLTKTSNRSYDCMVLYRETNTVLKHLFAFCCCKYWKYWKRIQPL